jgi:S-adenosylmethionine hydrolase
MASDLTVSGKLTGKIVNIDAEGNLISDLPSTLLAGAPRDSALRIVVDDEHETFGLFPTNHQQPAMTLVAVAEEGGPITIVLVNDSASAMLGTRVGAPVEVHW